MDTKNDRTKIARQFIEAIPHSRALGMTLDDIGEGTAALSMPYDERFIGNPSTAVIHGGAVFALMDTCGGTAVMSHADAPTGTATIDLRIDYMRPAKPGKAVFVRCECYRVTRSVAFTRGVAYESDPDDPVATAAGAFMITGKSSSNKIKGAVS